MFDRCFQRAVCPRTRLTATCLQHCFEVLSIYVRPQAELIKDSSRQHHQTTVQPHNHAGIDNTSFLEILVARRSFFFLNLKVLYFLGVQNFGIQSLNSVGSIVFPPEAMPKSMLFRILIDV